MPRPQSEWRQSEKVSYADTSKISPPVAQTSPSNASTSNPVDTRPDFISGINPGKNCYCQPNWWFCCNRCMKPETMMGAIGWYESILNMILLFVCLYFVILYNGEERNFESDDEIEGFTDKNSNWWSGIIKPTLTGVYMLALAYLFATMGGFILALCFHKFRRWPGFFWIGFMVFGTGIEIVVFRFFPGIVLNWINLLPMIIRVYELWCILTWDNYILAYRAWEINNLIQAHPFTENLPNNSTASTETQTPTPTPDPAPTAEHGRKKKSQNV